MLHSDVTIPSLDRIQWAFNEESNWIQHRTMVTCTASECSLSADGHTLYINQYLYHSFDEYNKYKYAVNFIGKYTIPTNWESQPKEVACSTVESTSFMATTGASSNSVVTTEKTTINPIRGTLQTTSFDQERIYMEATCRNRQLEIKLHLGKAKSATLEMLQFAVDDYYKWAHPPPMLNCVKEDCRKTGDIVTIKKIVNADNIKFAVNIMTHTVLPPCELWFDYPYYMRCDGSTLNGLEFDHLNKCPHTTQTVPTSSTILTSPNTISKEPTTLTKETTLSAISNSQSTTETLIYNKTSHTPTQVFTYPVLNTASTVIVPQRTLGVSQMITNEAQVNHTGQTQHQDKVWMEAVCSKSGNLTVTLHLENIKSLSIGQIQYAVEDFYSWGNPPVLHICGQTGTDCILTGDTVIIHKQNIQSSFYKLAVHVGNNTILPPCDNWQAYPYSINCDGNILDTRITGYSSLCGNSHSYLETTKIHSVETTSNMLTVNYHNPYKIWMEATCSNDRDLTVKIHLGTANISGLDEVMYAVEGFYDWSNPPTKHICNESDCTRLGDTLVIKKQMTSPFNKLAVFLKNYTILPPCDNWVMFPYTVICNEHSVDSRTLGPPEEMYHCQNSTSPPVSGSTPTSPDTGAKTSLSINNSTSPLILLSSASTNVSSVQYITHPSVTKLTSSTDEKYTHPSKFGSINATFSSPTQASKTWPTQNIHNSHSNIPTTSAATTTGTFLDKTRIYTRTIATKMQATGFSGRNTMRNNASVTPMSTTTTTNISYNTDKSVTPVTNNTVIVTKFTSSQMLPDGNTTMSTILTTHPPSSGTTYNSNIVSTSQNNVNTVGLSLETTTQGCPPFPKDCPKGCATFDKNWCWTCDMSLCVVNSTSNRPYSTQNVDSSSFTTLTYSSKTRTNVPTSKLPSSWTNLQKPTSTLACRPFPSDCPNGCATFGKDWCWTCDLTLCVWSTTGSTTTGKQAVSHDINNLPVVTSTVASKHTITKPMTQGPGSSTIELQSSAKSQTKTTTQGCIPLPPSCPVQCMSYDDNFCQVCDFSLPSCDTSPPPSTNTTGHVCVPVFCVLNCGNPPKYKKDNFGCNICACDFTG